MASDIGVAPAARPGRLALYFRATRPAYVLTSLVPALAGALVAIGEDATWWLLPVALVALALTHGATNACNDVEDTAHGVDGPDKLDNSRVFSTGLLTVAEGRRLYGALFVLAFALGILICLVQGPALLVIGAIGILGGWLYTGGPWPYKYAGLGDPAIVWLMGPLLTQGAYTALTGDAFHAPAFWLGLPPGLLIAAVLQSNNAADVDDDRAAGLRTIAVRLGFPRARALYLASLAGGALAPVVLWATGLFGPWILLGVLVAPLVAGAVRTALAVDPSHPEALRPLVPVTAQVHLAASALLCIGVVLDRI